MRYDGRCRVDRAGAGTAGTDGGLLTIAVKRPDSLSIGGTAGFPNVLTVDTMDHGTAPGETERALPPRDGVFLKTKYRDVLGYTYA